MSMFSVMIYFNGGWEVNQKAYTCMKLFHDVAIIQTYTVEIVDLIYLGII